MGDNLEAVNLGSSIYPTAIACGTYHTCAIMSDATARCWGDNTDGQLGIGSYYTITRYSDDPLDQMGDSMPQ
eukprot:1376955-Rhodomonas_salina.1